MQKTNIHNIHVGFERSFSHGEIPPGFDFRGLQKPVAWQGPGTEFRVPDSGEVSPETTQFTTTWQKMHVGFLSGKETRIQNDSKCANMNYHIIII